MTRTMYDSVNLKAITHPLPDHSLVAYYLDGPRAVASVAEVATMFPGASLNPIDVNGTRANWARTVDCETSDVTPEMLEQWLNEFALTNPAYDSGARGVVYCDRSSIPAVRIGTGKHVLGRDYYIWVATGDGTVENAASLGLPMRSVIACQNHWLRGYDTSVVFTSQFLPN